MSAIPEPAPAEPQADDSGGLDCSGITVGVAATPLAIGYFLLCLIVYGQGSDPFGAGTLLSLLWIGIGCLILLVVALFGLVGHLRRGRPRRAAAIGAALGVGLLVAAAASGWDPLRIGSSAWSIVAVTMLLAIAATLAVTTGRHAIDWTAVLGVGLLAVAFGWRVESDLAVRIVYNSSPMRAAAADGLVIFQASESGSFAAHLGPGCGGPIIADGVYGPGWQESDEAEEQRVPLGDTGLVQGENVVTVCVRSGIAFGEDQAVVTVDDTPPPTPSLEIEPTTAAAENRVAATRTLTFSGTITEPAHIQVEMNGGTFREPELERTADGYRWAFAWELSARVDRATFSVTAVDGAGNTTRSAGIHVRFAGVDPPPVRSLTDPDIVVECRGEPRLTPKECRNWADAVLTQRPRLLRSTDRLVLVAPDRFGNCLADRYDQAGTTIETGLVACP